MITIGDLDRRIMIQKAETTINTTYGSANQSWSDFSAVWAKYFVKGGKVKDESDQLVAEENAFFIIRDPKFTSVPFDEYNYRISFNDKFYIIENIREVENRINDYLEVKTTEKNNNG
tara:strand:- start:10525 stop:10875 length:351 start_codon:yes stop_codon:yes gene_type:complete